MNLLDKVYYFIYCFNTVKKADPPGSIANRENISAGFGATKLLYWLASSLYISAVLIYVINLLGLDNEPQIKKPVFISLFAILFLFIYVYFTKREQQIVKYYGVLRTGKENRDWIRGIIFFVGSIAVFLLAISAL